MVTCIGSFPGGSRAGQRAPRTQHGTYVAARHRDCAHLCGCIARRIGIALAGGTDPAISAARIARLAERVDSCPRRGRTGLHADRGLLFPCGLDIARGCVPQARRLVASSQPTGCCWSSPSVRSLRSATRCTFSRVLMRRKLAVAPTDPRCRQNAGKSQLRRGRQHRVDRESGELPGIARRIPRASDPRDARGLRTASRPQQVRARAPAHDRCRRAHPRDPAARER